jgi:hypothetical protein
MKFRLGEKVRVKSKEEIQKAVEKSMARGGVTIMFVKEMEKYCGKVFTIRSSTPVISGVFHYYTLNGVQNFLGHFMWCENWLEPLTKRPKR